MECKSGNPGVTKTLRHAWLTCAQVPGLRIGAQNGKTFIRYEVRLNLNTWK